MQLAGKGHGFFRIAHVRFGDDLDQRRAGPVQVDAGHGPSGFVGERFMQRFAGVFLQVGVVNAHALASTVLQLQLDHAGADDGLGQLGGLIALGQIRIKIIFPFEH